MSANCTQLGQISRSSLPRRAQIEGCTFNLRYFLDVGLAAYLIGIENAKQVHTHPLRGQLFENLVVVEALKHRFNAGRRSNLHFYRDRSGHEVDLIHTVGTALIAAEAKAGATIATDSFDGLKKLADLLPETTAELVLVHGGDTERVQLGVHVTPCSAFAPLLSRLEEKLSEGEAG